MTAPHTQQRKKTPKPIKEERKKARGDLNQGNSNPVKGHHDGPRSLPLFPTLCAAGQGVSAAGAGLQPDGPSERKRWKEEAKIRGGHIRAAQNHQRF